MFTIVSDEYSKVIYDNDGKKIIEKDENLITIEEYFSATNIKYTTKNLYDSIPADNDFSNIFIDGKYPDTLDELNKRIEIEKSKTEKVEDFSAFLENAVCNIDENSIDWIVTENFINKLKNKK